MLSLRALPVAFRALFSSFLILMGIGYLTAVSYLFRNDIEPHRKLGQGLVEAISEKYHGVPKDSRLEAALKGPMSAMITGSDRAQVLDWVHNGAPKSTYQGVAPLFKQHRTVCHSATSSPT